MKPLIFFFWFFLITINLMAKEPIVSQHEKSPLIIANGYNYFVLELQMNAIVCAIPLSSSQIIRISNKHSHVIMHPPHPFIKVYKTGKCSEFKKANVEKHIALTNCKSNNLNFNFLEETHFYGKAPPEGCYTEANISRHKVISDKFGRTSVNTLTKKNNNEIKKLQI